MVPKTPIAWYMYTECHDAVFNQCYHLHVYRDHILLKTSVCTCQFYTSFWIQGMYHVTFLSSIITFSIYVIDFNFPICSTWLGELCIHVKHTKQPCLWFNADFGCVIGHNESLIITVYLWCLLSFEMDFTHINNYSIISI